MNEESLSSLCVYDFANSICSFYSQGSTRIVQVEINDNDIYFLAQNPNGQMVLTKLFEMEDNVKIHTLMKKNCFMEAKKIAKDAEFPPDIIAEICKEHADKMYSQKNFEEAIVQYKETIGFLNPSYVIQKFI